MDFSDDGADEEKARTRCSACTVVGCNESRGGNENLAKEAHECPKRQLMIHIMNTAILVYNVKATPFFFFFLELKLEVARYVSVTRN